MNVCVCVCVRGCGDAWIGKVWIRKYMCVRACEEVVILLVTQVCCRKYGEGLAKEIYVCVCV